MTSMSNVPLSKRMFEKYDKDHNKGIDAQEFHALCYDLGHQLDPTYLTVLFAKVDLDGDGMVNYTEFLEWWRWNQNGNSFRF